MNQALLGQLAGLLAAAAFIPYIISILRGETKPQRATFAIWTFVSTVTLISYIASGATTTIWLLVSYVLFQGVVFLLSLKYGMGGKSRLDVICLIGAVLGMVVWAITRDPELTVYLGTAAEFLGFIPLFRKAYAHPETENLLAWVIGMVAAGLNLLALTTFWPEIAVYPLMAFFSEVILASLLLRRYTRKRTKTGK